MGYDERMVPSQNGHRIYGYTAVFVPCLIAVLMASVLDAYSQEPSELSDVSALDSHQPPVQQLKEFYSTNRGLIGFLQGPWIERGAKLEKDVQKQLRKEVERCLEKRKSHLAVAEKLGATDSVFWKEVVSDEMGTELKLAALIGEKLPHSLQSAMLIENRDELAATTFYAHAFWRLAGLSEQQQKQIVDKMKRQMLLRAEMFSKPPSSFTGEARLNLLEGLTLKQLEVLFVLQARMDEGVTIEQYLERAKPDERNFLATANQEVREVLLKKVRQ